MKLRHRLLRKSRLTCLFLGHEKWGDVVGSWFCTRCLKTHGVDLELVRHPRDHFASDEDLMRALQAAVRLKSRHLADLRPPARD